jgi:DNA-binding transcriptional LysR family regulator
MNVELRHLRYFVAVAEEASFTSAARRVHVAQQVLSTQIRQLEESIGARLLERTSRGVTLTPAGSAFLDAARDTLSTLERGVTSARNSAQAVPGQLSVGLSLAASGETRTALLSAFQRTYPHVEVRLRTFDLTHPAAGLLDHSTDVALVRPPVIAPGLSLEPVGEEPRVFVLPAGHPLAERGQLTLADVAGLPWIAAEAATDGCDPDRWRDDWLVIPRPGGDQPIIGAVARTMEEWREHIAAGRGISLCPASAEQFNARPGVAFVAGKGVPSTTMCVAWRTGDPRPAVRSFVEVATAAAREAPAPWAADDTGPTAWGA